jgi:EEF1A N-terminal glycine/lysine methyltransferase
VIYSHREHGNLIITMQRTLKKSPNAAALVVFTPYQPWLLEKIVKFFPLAERNGFCVTKVFEKLMETVLFENDPGVCHRIPTPTVISVTIDEPHRMRN